MTQDVMNLTRVSIDIYQVSKHSSALYCKTALVVFFFPLCLSLSRCASRGHKHLQENSYDRQTGLLCIRATT